MGDAPQNDDRRDAWLITQGFDAILINAAELLKDADDSADGIVRYINEKAGKDFKIMADPDEIALGVMLRAKELLVGR